MILLGAFAIALISKDALEKKALAKKNNPSEATVEAVEVTKSSKNRSLEDFFASQIKLNVKKDEIDTTPKTVTEFALFEFFGNYNNLKSQNLNTRENLENLTTSVANQTKQLANLPSKYSLYSLKTFPDYNKQKSKIYGQEFAKLTLNFKKGLLLATDSDAETHIRKYTNEYKDYAKKMSELDVPRGISVEHLDFINNLEKIAESIITILETNNDPLLSALVLDQYNKIQEKQPEILIKISDYFELNGIIFAEGESGEMWNNF